MFATLRLEIQANGILAKGALTDSTGRFEMNNIAPGTYQLYVSSLNIPKQLLKELVLEGDQKHRQLSNILIEEDAQNLPQVEVKSKRPLFEKRIDRTIVNLNQSPLAVGNTVFEVLRYLPGISTSPNGEISLYGAPGVQIIIDGKGLRMSREEALSMLSNMGAENIEKLEIYATPPAKFDAQGSSIINIITKKDKMYSNANLSYGQLLYPSSSVFGTRYYNWRSGVDLHYGFERLKLSALITASTEQNFNESEVQTILPTLERRTRTEGQFDNNLLSANLRGQFLLNANNHFFVQTRFLALPATDNRTSNQNTELILKTSKEENFQSVFINNAAYFKPDILFNYVHYFDDKKQHSISIDAIYSAYDHDQSTRLLDDESIALIQQQNDTELEAKALRLDYSTLLPGAVKMSLGGKYTTLNYSALTAISVENNVFDYDENITAAYLSVSKRYKNWAFKAGLRTEHTDSEGRATVRPDTTVRFDYLRLFPSLFVLHTPGQNLQFRLSYSRRINRPSFEHFNPQRIWSTYDQFTRIAGAPNLLPTLTDRIHLSTSWKKLSVNLIYNHEQNVRVNVPLPSNENILNLATINTAVNSINNTISYPVTFNSKWSSSNNLSVTWYESQLLEETRTSLAWNINSSHIFKLAPTHKIEGRLSYRSAYDYNYWRLGGRLTIDLAWSTRLYKKVKLKFGVENILGSTAISWDTDYGQLATLQDFLSNDRRLRLSLSYQFKTGNRFNTKQKQSSDGDIR